MWLKYWSFCISPSNEYLQLISFRIDWFDLLAVQGTFKSLLRHDNSKASILQCSAFFMVSSVQLLSRVRLCDPMNRSTPGLPVHHQLPEFTQSHVHRVSDAILFIFIFILCRPLLLLPPMPPSIKVFSNESILHIRWPKYWRFSFSITPYNEYSGLVSFRIDLFDILAVQGTLKSLF